MLNKLLKREKISNIKVTSEFLATRPRERKLIAKAMYYAQNGRFERPVILDENNVLVDGYTTYIIAKELEMKYVPVKRIKSLN
ncbi:MAG: hypothetical protein IKG42_04810 [Clostridia bacterium]|nr:hypothetical protein [Clostridia bacterium]